MKFLAILFSVVMLSLPVKAYELLMFSVKTCHFCIAFHEQVVPEYNDTEYAEILPLTIIDAEGIPDWFHIAYDKGYINKIKGTPTFIIWNEETQQEVDRIVGYNGKEWFYERIELWIEEYYGQ